MDIDKIKIENWYVKIKTLLDEKESGEFVINNQLARNILMEVLNDMEKLLRI